MDKLDFLIDYLLKENKEIQITKIPEDLEEKKNLYRALCNIRDAKPIDEEYIKIENEYLQKELKRKNITNVKNIPTILESMSDSNIKNKISLWKGDITTLEIDAIVNAANSQGLGCFLPLHLCIDNCIHSASGVSLRLECAEKMKEIKKLQTGKAFLTKAYNLPSKYVIHTVGPIIYNEVTIKEKQELKNCYINSLELAKKNGIKTIAFPCISTGEFRYPKKEACIVAIKAVEEYLEKNEKFFDKIIFNVFSDEDYDIYIEQLK